MLINNLLTKFKHVISGRGAENHKIQQQGLTLVELIVSIAVGSMVLLWISSILVDGINTRKKATAVTQVQKASVNIVSDITRELRWAKSVTVPNPGELDITDTDDNTITYQLNGANQLTKNSTVLHSDKVIITNISFTAFPENNPAPNRVTIKITLQHTDFPDVDLDTVNTVSVRIAKIGV